MEKEKSEEKINEEKFFENEADVIKHITTIHKENSRFSPDYVLFRTNEDKIKKFIRNHYKISGLIKQFVKDEEVGEEIATALEEECDAIAILERNNPNNWLLKKLFGWKEKNDENLDDIGLKTQIMDATFGKKQPQPEND